AISPDGLRRSACALLPQLVADHGGQVASVCRTNHASGRAQALRSSCEVLADAMSPAGLRRSPGALLPQLVADHGGQAASVCRTNHASGRAQALRSPCEVFADAK